MVRAIRPARGLSDEKLISAVREVENGLIDGDLGGGLIKKRIGRAGAGKRGGYRSIIALKQKNRAVFVYGFAKSAVDNLDNLELSSYRKFCWALATDIATAIDAGELRALDYDAKQISK